MKPEKLTCVLPQAGSPSRAITEIWSCYWKRSDQISTSAEKGGYDGIIPGSPAEHELSELLNDPNYLDAISTQLHVTARNRGIAICVMGQEGSGKTTLSSQIRLLLEAAGIPVRRIHVFRFLDNIVKIPAIILVNRYFKKEVLIFDRSIFDNIVVHAEKKGIRGRIAWTIFHIVTLAYPKFDHRFYLHCPFDITQERRRNACRENYIVMKQSYEHIAMELGFIATESTRPLLRNVMGIITKKEIP